VRKGAYKAHFQTGPGYAAAGEKLVFEKRDPPLLFNVLEDPSERYNLAADHADILSDLSREVEKHRSTLVPGTAQY
jgi:hypothetical protein